MNTPSEQSWRETPLAERYISLLARKYSDTTDAILKKIDNDPMYADFLDIMFKKHHENKALRARIRESKIDTLTGVHGKKAYKERLSLRCDSLNHNNRKNQGSSWLFMIDCDHFKAVNDRYGHAAGDHALKEVVRIITQSTREEDFIARLGGDEFAIILDKCTKSEAHGIAEKLRLAVKGNITYPVAGEEIELGITLSIGVAPVMNTQKNTEIGADGALYCAKGEPNHLVVAHPKGFPGNRNTVFTYIPEGLAASSIQHTLH